MSHLSHPRAILTRQIIDFFNTHLRGIFSWDDVILRPAEKAEKIPGRRQIDKEIATVDFAGYSIMISSPDEKPPLGEVMLFSLEHGILAQGAIDTATWDRVAEAIKAHEKKDMTNVA